MTDAAAPDIADQDGRTVDADLLEAATPDGPRARGGGVGRPRFYSYNNLADPPQDRQCSCGHAAIASLLDFHGRVPLPAHLLGPQPAEGLADDGRPHFPNEILVRRIFDAWPPTNWLNIRFVPRETLHAAFRHAGLKTGESWPALLMSEQQRFAVARKGLCDWIGRTGLPVITLVDTAAIYGEGGLHWGIIHAFDDQGVLMASWHTVRHVPWATFAEAWHCRGWIFPNNFYALYVAP